MHQAHPLACCLGSTLLISEEAGLAEPASCLVRHQLLAIVLRACV